MFGSETIVMLWPVSLMPVTAAITLWPLANTMSPLAEALSVPATSVSEPVCVIPAAEPSVTVEPLTSAPPLIAMPPDVVARLT